MPIAPNLDPANLLPQFESSLPGSLRLSGERALLRFHELTRETYTTERFLSDSPTADTLLLKAIPMESDRLLRCEAASPALVSFCSERGIKLADNAYAQQASKLLEIALSDVIKPLRFLWTAVSELVWCCHVVLAQADDYDMSFSDPGIPFSVFVSAPAQYDRLAVLRVAENLVHETMHLQLTLFEDLCPLIDRDSGWSMYSPWKQEQRPAQGILHGLYVFYVLRWMWLQISQTTHRSTDRDFALRRILDIDGEIDAVRALENSPALTEAGKRFLQELFVSRLHPEPS
jgi:hypothetical protein